MQNREIAAAQIGPLISGLLDVMFAFAIILEQRGVLSREELVEGLIVMQAEIAEQEGGPSARSTVVDMMTEAFRLPIAGKQTRARFTVIDGGAGSGDRA
jgi:hypothetical protein